MCGGSRGSQSWTLRLLADNTFTFGWSSNSTTMGMHQPPTYYNNEDVAGKIKEQYKD